MRTWRYIEPTSATDMTPVEHVLTDNEILEQTYPGWARRCMEWNAEHTHRQIPITPLACIEDFVVVHWAEQVKRS